MDAFIATVMANKAIAAAVAAGLVGLYLVWPKRKTAPPKYSDRVVLQMFERWEKGTASASPGCARAEAFLRLAGVPHDVNKSGKEGPTGRWPYVEHRGKYVSDSSDIVAYAAALSGKPELLDKNIADPQRRAEALLLSRVCEQSLYFSVVRYRWVDNIDALVDAFVLPVPYFAKSLIMRRFIRPEIIKTCDYQGNGARDNDQYRADAVETVQAMIDTLRANGTLTGSGFFAGRATPGEIDCTLYAYLANVQVELAGARPQWPVAALMKKDAALQAYLKRVATAIYPDDPKPGRGSVEKWDPR